MMVTNESLMEMIISTQGQLKDLNAKLNFLKRKTEPKARYGVHIFLKEILEKHKNGLNLKELISEVKKSGKFFSNNFFQLIYSSIRTHPNLFEKKDDGAWGLKMKS